MIVDWIKDKLERRPEPIVWTNPEHGTQGTVIVLEEDQRLEVLNSPEPTPLFKPVRCLHAASFCDYLKRHACVPTTIVFASETGLYAIADYCDLVGQHERPEAEGSTALSKIVLNTAGHAKHRVTVPGEWSPDCAAAMAATEAAAGKWISLDTMESLLDVAAPFIKDVLKVRDVLLDLDGVEAVSAKRTANGSSLQVGSNVQAKEDRQIPGSMVFAGRFMGQAVVMEMPLRARVQNRAIQFHLVDNGSIRKAKMEAVSQAAQAVRAAGWFVTEGCIA